MAVWGESTVTADELSVWLLDKSVEGRVGRAVAGVGESKGRKRVRATSGSDLGIWAKKRFEHDSTSTKHEPTSGEERCGAQ